MFDQWKSLRNCHGQNRREEETEDWVRKRQNETERDKKRHKETRMLIIESTEDAAVRMGGICPCLRARLLEPSGPSGPCVAFLSCALPVQICFEKEL